MRIHVEYRPNSEYYDSDVSFFYGDYVFDLDRLKEFVAYSKDLEKNKTGWTYSGDEAERIVRCVETRASWDLEEHDKYTFFDTDDERKLVLSEDQDTSTADYTVTVLLHS